MASPTLVSRELSPFEPAVVTFGKISGGRAHNVIADTCELFGTMRCFNTETDAFLKERITATVEGVAASMRGRGTVTFSGYLPPVVNDEAITLRMRDILRTTLGEGSEHEVVRPSLMPAFSNSSIFASSTTPRFRFCS